MNGIFSVLQRPFQQRTQQRQPQQQPQQQDKNPCDDCNGAKGCCPSEQEKALKDSILDKVENLQISYDPLSFSKNELNNQNPPPSSEIVRTVINRPLK